MPEASGIDIICMSEPDFLSRIHLRNNLANNIAKEGCLVIPDENLNYRTEYEDEEVDWEDIEQKINDATGATNWIEAIQQAGILDAGDDKQFGRVAQNALEFAYKAVIAAHGHEYPASGPQPQKSSPNSSENTRASGVTKKRQAKTTAA